MEQNKIIKLLTGEKVKSKEREFSRVIGGFSDNSPVITDKQIGELLGYAKGARQVRDQVNNNIKHFSNNDIIDLQRGDTIENMEIVQTLGYAKQSISQAKNIYIFSELGFLLFLQIAEIKYNSEIKAFFKLYFNKNIYILDSIKQRKEHSFYNELVKKINDIIPYIYDYECNFSESKKNISKNKEIILPKLQFPVLNYRLDFYWERLGIIVEYDENKHEYQSNEDNTRMDNILWELCRINPSWTIGIEDGIRWDYDTNKPWENDENFYRVIRIKEGMEEQGINKIISAIIGRIVCH